MTTTDSFASAALTRRAFVQIGAASLAACALPRTASSRAPAGPLPSAAQLRWQRDELAMFLHFGVNTFTDREWGDGRESPSIFNPAALDAREWARVAKRTGFRSLILTAKHHDGFCLWPTRTTEHSVAKSPFRGGNGDVVRETADACRAEGLRLGLYLSPWDRNHAAYGSARYNDVYCDQLTELLTQYGPVAQVWFDGANGEGPNGKRQEYDFPRFFALVKRLAPDAVIFSDAGPDVRWCGNERGTAGDPNWSTVDPSKVPYPGASGEGVIDALQHGDPNGTAWRPAEVDVSIRPGWFHHPAEESRVRSAQNLTTLYFTSVGRNAKLLLNVPPTREGVLHPNDVAALEGFRASRDRTFANEVSRRVRATWRTTGARTAELVLELERASQISVARLSEDITRGQRVARYKLEGADDGGEWKTLAQGTTVGYAKLERFEPVRVRRVRVGIDGAVEQPERVEVRLFGD